MLINTKRFLSIMGTGIMSLALGICIGGICEKIKENNCCVIDEM